MEFDILMEMLFVCVSGVIEKGVFGIFEVSLYEILIGILVN